MAVQQSVVKLQNDSTLLEKRIRQLQEENDRLGMQNALTEQSMNERLREKQDSLHAKEQLLRDRELSLKDMKARKEEEREAFSTLTTQVLAEFSGYDRNTLVSTTGCTRMAVQVNDRKLFVPGSIKTEYLATEIATKAIDLLNRYPDLHLTIITYADSTSLVIKDKNNDPYKNASDKSMVLYRQILTRAAHLSPRITAGLASDNQSKRPFQAQSDYLFNSALLPCIHSK